MVLSDGTEMGNHKNYLQSEHWKRIKQAYMISNRPKECWCCKTKDQPLDLHHLHYQNVGNEQLEDLELLCRTCHAEVHRVTDGLFCVRDHIVKAMEIVKARHQEGTFVKVY